MLNKADPRQKPYLGAAVLLALAATACGEKQGGNAGADVGSTPVHLSIAGHIEDSKSYSDCKVYGPKRDQLLQFAQALDAYPVRFNLQVSYEWFQGVLNCENDAMKQSTMGLNLIDYLVDQHRFEIDVHQEGASLAHTSSGNNFADIRYLGGQVTSHMSDTTGFQWDNPAHYDAFQKGEAGKLHPEFSWQPSILAGGASMDHANGDHSRDMDSIGVWVPAGFGDDFHTHDTSADARMVYVGSGPNQFVADWGAMGECHFNDTADFVAVVSEYIATGKLPAGKMYTTTLVVPQPILFDTARRSDLFSILDKLLPLAKDGRLRFQHLSETVATWRNDYNSEPNIVRYSSFAEAERTCN